VETVPTVLVTGPIGVGKTTVAYAIAGRLRAARIPSALIDLDAIVQCYPAPPDDPFNFRLAMRNLAALWRNCRDAGARYLVLDWVVEARSELEEYCKAIPGAHITVVRLRAPIEVLDQRIGLRAGDSDREWELARTRQLSQEMDITKVEDLLVETEGRSAEEVADGIIARLGWPASDAR
jgi:adenylylsulfate kinase